MTLPAHWIDLQPGNTVPVEDRAYRYGESLFETLRYHRGCYHLLPAHLERLARGCSRLGLEYPEQQLQRQLELARTYLEENQHLQAGVRLTLSRLGAEPGYTPHGTAIRLAASLTPISLGWREHLPPAHMITCETRLAEQPALAGIKHGNRLEQVLAASEISASGADEGLLLNMAGEVICASSSNIFAVFDGSLVTPDLSRCGIAGTVRSFILSQSSLAGRVAEAALSVADLQQAEEVFLTNALIGVRSVAECVGRGFTSTAVADMVRQEFYHHAESSGQ